LRSGCRRVDLGQESRQTVDSEARDGAGKLEVRDIAAYATEVEALATCLACGNAP